MFEATTATKPHVLFVDDEPRILTSMRMLFRSKYQVTTATSAQEAIELLKAQPVEVIVSDQRMPNMTGIEFLREARDIAPNAMRILLTGYSDLNAIIGSINEGEIFRFVNKPWVNEELGRTLDRAIVAARESANASADDAPPLAADAQAPAVLVLDEDPQTLPQVRAILGDAFRTFGATSLDEAITLMEREHIGVVMSETRIQGHPVVGVISLLKQHQPELISVIVTERADAGTAIDLINQGQIYRLITKPIHDSQCRIAIGSALRQHHKLAQNPELHKRYEVAATPVDAPTPALPKNASSLLERIRGLRGLFKRSG